MEKVLKIIKELQSTNSKNDKQDIISRNLDNKKFDAILRFLFDDNIKTGIKRAKLNKTSNTYKLVIEGLNIKGGIVELMEFLKINNTGKENVVNIALATSGNLAKYYNIKIYDLVNSIICKDLKLGCSASTYNKANPNNPVFNYDVMAGKSWDENRARKMIENGETLFFSEKIDGNRGTRDMYTGRNLVSRNGKIWNGMDDIVSELNLLTSSIYVPEGELVYNDKSSKMTSQEIRSMTSSIMNDKNILNKAEAGIIFKIFECPLKRDFNDENEGESYKTRRMTMDFISKKIDVLKIKYVQVVPIEFTISNVEELKTVIPRLKRDYINKGKEGLMCISSKQPYKVGKGYQMMKLKNILSADLKIIGWNYGKEKTKWEGKFASFKVEFPYIDKKGKMGIYQVDVGTGYSDELRNEVNKSPNSYIGRLLEILITEVSKNKEGGYSLSYARLVDFRDDKDTIDLEKHTLVEIDGEYYFKED